MDRKTGGGKPKRESARKKSEGKAVLKGIDRGVQGAASEKSPLLSGPKRDIEVITGIQNIRRGEQKSDAKKRTSNVEERETAIGNDERSGHGKKILKSGGKGGRVGFAAKKKTGREV